VELNPQVVAIARHSFHVPDDDARLKVLIGDGAEHISHKGHSVDVIAVDGYDAESQVEELSSKPFYSACHKRLNANGILVVNLWGSDRAFHDTLLKFEAAFPSGTLCLPAEKPGNIIVFAFKDCPASWRWEALSARARELEKQYTLEFPRFVAALRKMNRHDKDVLHA
jgi:spermidine synthase